MKKALALIFSIMTLVSCNNVDAPDVSDIHVDVTVQRFDRDFFAMDSERILPSLQQLYAKYPSFFSDYLQNILGLPPITDTSIATVTAVRQFLSDYTRSRQQPISLHGIRSFPGLLAD